LKKFFKNLISFQFSGAFGALLGSIITIFISSCVTDYTSYKSEKYKLSRQVESDIYSVHKNIINDIIEIMDSASDKDGILALNENQVSELHKKLRPHFISMAILHEYPFVDRCLDARHYKEDLSKLETKLRQPEGISWTEFENLIKKQHTTMRGLSECIRKQYPSNSILNYPFSD